MVLCDIDVSSIPLFHEKNRFFVYYCYQKERTPFIITSEHIYLHLHMNLRI